MTHHIIHIVLAILAAITMPAIARAENPTPAMTTQQADTASAKIKVTTSLGDFTILLYGDTPAHRDNFLKLVSEKFYDGLLFHRVIKDFMIQAGDPDSRNAPAGKRLGAGGPGYQIDAEIIYPRHYHKRGALAAARQGDATNPMRRSSGSQFYIVTGRPVSPASIQNLETQAAMQQRRDLFDRLVNENRDRIIALQQQRDSAGLETLRRDLIARVEAAAAQNPVTLSPQMISDYTAHGGAPHLDGQYTVFGEVIDGMDVIDKIEKAATDPADRPTDDIKIISMEIIPADNK